MYRMSRGQKVFTVFNYALLTVLSLSCLLPFVHLVALSFSDKVAVDAGKVAFWPVDFTVKSYEFVFRDGRFFRAFWNSVKRVVLVLAVQMTLLVITAYPMSRTKERLPGRNIIMGYFVFTWFASGGLIPLYLVIAKLKLVNNILVYAVTWFAVSNMVILINFIRGLPDELEDAARIDGAGEIQTLFRVLLPLLKPCLATLALFNFVAQWNDWFSGRIYMKTPDRYPLQTYLQSLLTSIDEMMKSAELNNTDMASIVNAMNARTGRAAQLFLAALPIMLVYPFLQKYFTAGMTLGSVKG